MLLLYTQNNALSTKRPQGIYCGGKGEIRTHGFRDLQSLALGLSATFPYYRPLPAERVAGLFPCT